MSRKSASWWRAELSFLFSDGVDNTYIEPVGAWETEAQNTASSYVMKIRSVISASLLLALSLNCSARPVDKAYPYFAFNGGVYSAFMFKDAVDDERAREVIRPEIGDKIIEHQVIETLEGSKETTRFQVTTYARITSTFHPVVSTGDYVDRQLEKVEGYRIGWLNFMNSVLGEPLGYHVCLNRSLDH
jgi:hypothetical protein